MSASAFEFVGRFAAGGLFCDPSGKPGCGGHPSEAGGTLIGNKRHLEVEWRHSAEVVGIRLRRKLIRHPCGMPPSLWKREGLGEAVLRPECEARLQGHPKQKGAAVSGNNGHLLMTAAAHAVRRIISGGSGSAGGGRRGGRRRSGRGRRRAPYSRCCKSTSRQAPSDRARRSCRRIPRR